MDSTHLNSHLGGGGADMARVEAADGLEAGAALPPNNLVLFVRAGKNGESLGGCPFCQRMFMVLLIKTKDEDVVFTVKTVSMAKAPLDFKRVASRLPVIMHGTEIVSDRDEMITYVDEHFPDPPMAYDNVRAARACQDVFSKFSFYIKDVSHTASALLTELRRLDDYLAQSPHRFLTRDFPDHLDCIMLPKLQHIRVVAKAFKDFEIPASLRGFWRYMANAYALPIFRRTCTSDQEIVYHWASKPEMPRLSKERQRLYAPEGVPRFSFDVPAES